MLLTRIPKRKKRATRWRSQAHLTHVRQHCCAYCDTQTAIEAAHVRMGSGAGMGQKPDDWRAVPLCRDCHREQHTAGEPAFWSNYQHHFNATVEDVIAELIRTSPRRHEIETEMRERGQ